MVWLWRFLARYDWVCVDCMAQAGRWRNRVSTFHYRECEICRRRVLVTRRRDFGSRVPPEK
jgi:DNA-directed RNA polymerase subunit RPC12/RpoP